MQGEAVYLLLRTAGNGADAVFMTNNPTLSSKNMDARKSRESNSKPYTNTI